MSRLSTFLLGMAVGALLIYAAMHFHLVRAQDGFHVVGKLPPRLSETYVDIRGFGVADWASRPQLAAALVQADKQYLIGNSAAGALQDGANQFLQGWPSQ